eukprot:gene3792-4315_t
MDLDALRRKLVIANKQIYDYQNKIQELNEKLAYAVSEQRSSVFLLCELRKRLDKFREERDYLKIENESLRIELENTRKNNSEETQFCTELNSSCQLSTPLENGSSQASSCSAFSSPALLTQHKESVKIHQLERELMIANRENKQLKTHLHWLSRQCSSESIDEMYKNGSFMRRQLSLEEGQKVSIGALNLLKSEAGNNRKDHFNQPNAKPERHGANKDCKPINIITRLKALKSILLTAKQKVRNNNELSDTIFQLSFQNLRHPFEPQSYSNWSSSEGFTSLSLSASLDRSNREHYPQALKFGFHSLEGYSMTENNKDSLYNSSVYRRQTSSSSPEINFISDMYSTTTTPPENSLYPDSCLFRHPVDHTRQMESSSHQSHCISGTESNHPSLTHVANENRTFEESTNANYQENLIS